MSAAVLLSLLLAGAAFAQETTGALAGRLVDAQGMGIADATVAITGPQGSKAFLSDANGRFFAPFLVPATYGLRAELQGFKAVDITSVTVRLGQTTQVVVRMEAGRLTETIEAIGSQAMIDPTSTTIGAMLAGDLFHRVPVGRRVTDTVNLAPGVPLDTFYVVDGVNVAPSAIEGRSPAIPFDVVNEVLVKTGGYEAEFGPQNTQQSHSTGSIVNVVTRSGGNETRGSLFGYTHPGERKQTDVGAGLGGRILPNRLFYFGAVDPSWQTSTGGELDRRQRSLFYAAKTTWQMTPLQRFDFSLFGDPADGEPEVGGHRQALRYHGMFGSHMLFETSVSHPDSEVAEHVNYAVKTTVVVGDHAFKTGFLSEDARRVFVQDHWKAHERLTLNAGVRYEGEDWAPRAGLVYDPLGNARSRLYAHWGRYVARVALEDELVAGYEWEAIPNMSLGARVIHRDIDDALELTVDRRLSGRWSIASWYRVSRRDFDRLKMFGSYGFANGLSIGTALTLVSDAEFDVQASYTATLGGQRRLTLVAAAFHVFEPRFALRLGVRFGW